MTTAHFVFVYGTLLRGCSNHELLAAAEFIGECETDQRFTMLHLGGFPAVIDPVNGETGTRITGELYRVEGETLDALDRLEGYPRLYDRRQVVVAGLECWAEGAWIYTLADGYCTRYNRIPSGDWRHQCRA